MAKIKSENEQEKQLDIIYSLLKQQPLGLTISALESALKDKLAVSMNRRTLLRRLGVMKDRGQIISRGGGNVIHYLISERTPEFAMTPSHQALRESEKIAAYIHQPMIKRKPVGYNHDFLDSYQPGETYYLQESLRNQLNIIGQSSQIHLDQGKVGETYVKKVYRKLLVDLSWSSSRLEGNTYTRSETQNLIEFGQVATGRDLTETQMILNHKAAIEMMVENADRIGFDAYTICTLHANLSDDLLSNALDSGRLRQMPVQISGSSYMPMAIPDQIRLTFHKILEKASKITDPYEQSFFIMVHLPYLQPFIDVNKRVSRLASNIPFIKNNLCPLSFIEVDEKAYVDGLLAIYELNTVEVLKEVYMWAYERSCQRLIGVVQIMVEPNPLRLRYRGLIMSVVKAVVEQLETPTIETIDRLLNGHTYQPLDQHALQEILLKEFASLHEGNAGRYGLTLSQYYKWRTEAFDN